MAGLEGVFGADNFAFEEGCQGWVVFGQTLDAEVAAEIGFVHVDVLDLDVDIVDLSVGLLGPCELAASPEKGGSVVW